MNWIITYHRYCYLSYLYINARVCLFVCLSSIEMDMEALIKKPGPVMESALQDLTYRGGLELIGHLFIHKKLIIHKLREGQQQRSQRSRVRIPPPPFLFFIFIFVEISEKGG